MLILLSFINIILALSQTCSRTRYSHLIIIVHISLIYYTLRLILNNTSHWASLLERYYPSEEYNSINKMHNVNINGINLEYPRFASIDSFF